MQPNERIYLDYAATTPLDPYVLEKMMPFFQQDFGNPSSVHYWGQKAEGAIHKSRKKTADLLNALEDEIIFTSGGTESNNLALRGICLKQQKEKNKNHILISPVEHHAVLHTARQLGDLFNMEIELIPVNEFGLVCAEQINQMVRPETSLVSVIYANNEVGTINPIRKIAAVCRNKEVIFHTDAVQAMAHLPINVQEDDVDLLTFGAHKFYGPKGTGGLYKRKGIDILTMNTGGGQEFGLRAGTENVPYVYGMAEALEINRLQMTDQAKRLIILRNQIINNVLERISGARLSGHPEKRLPNHASFVFESVDGNTLVSLLDSNGFACSSGSACKAGSPKPSEVLKAMGFPENWTKGSLRVTLGRQTTAEQAERFCQVLPGLVEKARSFK